MRRAWVLIVGAALLAGIGPAAAQGQMDAEFRKLADEFSAAWSKGDAKAIAALHTADAIRAQSEAPTVIGRAAIEQGMAAALTGPFKGTTLTITQGQSKRVTADVYVGEGTWEVTGAPAAAGLTKGRYVNTLVRQGGTWLIASSSTMPLASQ